MKISPSVAGFIKGLVIVVLYAVVGYVGDINNLQTILNPVTAGIVASLIAALESALKAKSNGQTALFGAVKLK